MTTQSPDRKTPEEIAYQICAHVANWTSVPYSRETIEEYKKQIAQAIAQERASKPTLVLPEKRNRENQGKYGWNDCIDEVIRLNAPTVCEENK